MMGLAARAGAVVAGTARVRDAIRSRSVRFVVVAADAAPGQQNRLLPGLEAAGIGYAIGHDRDALGAAIGRAPVSAVAFTQAGFAESVANLLKSAPSERARGRIEGAGRES